MKLFCPNCGAPLKLGAKFCPKCGAKITEKKPHVENIEQGAPAPNFMPPKKPHKKGKIIAACIILLLLLLGAGGYYLYTSHNSNAASQILKQKHTKKAHQNKKAKKPASHYSTKDWMLMGYLNYARKHYARHISDTKDLIHSVGSDIKHGDLHITKNESNKYTVSNKNGKVDVTVTKNNVTVKDDKENIMSKSELKDDFGSYLDLINAITKTITGNDSVIQKENTDADKNNDQDKPKTDTKEADDKDLASLPADMQGTWYSAGSDKYGSDNIAKTFYGPTLTIGAHTINGDKIQKYPTEENAPQPSGKGFYGESQDDKTITTIAFVNFTELGRTDANGHNFYHLNTDQGMTYIFAGSGPSIGGIIYFKNRSDANKFKGMSSLDIYYKFHPEYKSDNN